MKVSQGANRKTEEGSAHEGGSPLNYVGSEGPHAAGDGVSEEVDDSRRIVAGGHARAESISDNGGARCAANRSCGR